MRRCVCKPDSAEQNPGLPPRWVSRQCRSVSPGAEPGRSEAAEPEEKVVAAEEEEEAQNAPGVKETGHEEKRKVVCVCCSESLASREEKQGAQDVCVCCSESSASSEESTMSLDKVSTDNAWYNPLNTDGSNAAAA